MRFLADDFPGAAVSALRIAGHDVSWLSERAPGAEDADVLLMAVDERRILLTFDKDFGELAWSAGLPASCGIVLFRLPTPPAAAIGSVLLARIEERGDWAGHFSVVETGRVRMRSLSGARSGDD